VFRTFQPVRVILLVLVDELASLEITLVQIEVVGVYRDWIVLVLVYKSFNRDTKQE
jgi:hypothetical protein